MAKSNKVYFKYFAIITLLKLILAIFFPITGDEAYFFQWGQHPHVVYYDHPSLIGWWMWFAQLFGSHIFFARTLMLAVGGLVSWMIYLIVFHLTKDRSKGLLTAALYYTTPMSLLSIMITTDTTLLLFVVMSGYFFLRSIEKHEPLFYLYSAITLGLAFWSKYLMAFMVPALIFASLMSFSRIKDSIKYFTTMTLIGLVFIILHLYWSSQNCWQSIMFNLFNRENDIAFGYSKIFLFLIFQVYLATPWLLLQFSKSFKTYWQNKKSTWTAATILYLLPVLLLFIPSSHDPNLHWAMAYVPFLFMSFGMIIDSSWMKYLKWNLVFSLLHAVLLLTLTFIPDHYLSKNKFYADVVMGKYGNEIEEALNKEKDDFIFGTLGYTTGGLMEYHTHRHYIVFKDIDTNGRNDDYWTDYRQLDGKNLLLISTYKYRDNEVQEYQNYFEKIEYSELNIRGAIFYIAKGYGFRFENYRTGYLTWAKNKFYQFPGYLPKGQCFFNERYFPK